MSEDCCITDYQKEFLENDLKIRFDNKTPKISMLSLEFKASFGFENLLEGHDSFISVLNNSHGAFVFNKIISLLKENDSKYVTQWHYGNSPLNKTDRCVVLVYNENKLYIELKKE